MVRTWLLLQETEEICVCFIVYRFTGLLLCLANNKFVEFPVAFLLTQEIQYIRNATAAVKNRPVLRLQ
jgi:hypothetical protein